MFVNVLKIIRILLVGFFVIMLLSIGSSVSSLETETDFIASSDPKQFYVGVTYGGDSVSDATQLIDKVKNHTNLLVIQSGLLQYGHRLDELNQIIDYAVDSNLDFIVYFSQYWDLVKNWVKTFDPRWNTHFLGIYFGDEPAGKMLDDFTSFYRGTSPHLIEKWIDGSVKVNFKFPNAPFENDPKIIYYSNGTIFVEKLEFDDGIKTIYATYSPNGTISVKILDRITSSIQDGDKTDIPYSREEAQNMYPFKNYDEAADLFVDLYRTILTNEIRNNNSVTFFTSEYALHWFDYLLGYDVVFTQIGWNHTIEQDIALVRGAANLQNKSWGAIITWKDNQPPYLDSGEAIYQQMQTVYEAGAKYAILFNYAENMSGPFGTLQDEHFVALERFWHEVVQNSSVQQGSITSEAVLVLPQNYGWGMRRLNDTIWGLWEADEKSEQIWNLKNSLIEEYGLNLDIVYDDPDFSVEGKYVQTFYAVEKHEPFYSPWIIPAIATLVVVGTGFLFYLKKRSRDNQLIKNSNIRYIREFRTILEFPLLTVLFIGFFAMTAILGGFQEKNLEMEE